MVCQPDDSTNSVAREVRESGACFQIRGREEWIAGECVQVQTYSYDEYVMTLLDGLCD